MNALTSNELLIERRGSEITESDLWEQLSLAQKFSASSLTQFGYKLVFVRSASNKAGIAVLLCNDNHATIALDGEIDTSPKISIRAEI